MSVRTAGLSTAQKAALCMGSDFLRTAALPEAGIEPLVLSDGPHGVRRQTGPFPGPGRPATCFPSAAALASSWDAGLVREVGAALGREARAQDVDVVLGPGVNIKRSPLCGRNFEYFSEDPVLSGRLGGAMVAGIQSEQVGACVKHFAAHNQETDRLRVSADVDERTLREIYLPAFEHIVTTARPWAVMSSYNKLNGTFTGEHRWLLTELLRGEWGFDGVVISDWGSVHDRVAALRAGLDLEMPPNPGVSERAIVDAVASGLLPEATLDGAVTRLERLARRAAARRPAELSGQASYAIARRAAAAGTVLLKNDGGVLPVRDRRGLRVAVIGEFARQPYIQGLGSAEVTPLRVDVPLDELTAALPSAAVSFAAGYPLRREGRTGPAAGDRGAGRQDPESRALAVEALAAARDADLVVVFLGLPPGAEVENIDRRHIDLPAAQTDVVAALADAVTVPLVAVLCNGSVVRTSTWDHRVAAVLECWLGGQAAGGALADVLTGTVNPSGRLAETIPLRLQDVPSYLSYPGEEGHVRYGEGVFVG